MVIDIIFLIFMLGAVVRGWQRGLIVALFSLLACIAGLAAAIKLSAVVAAHLHDSVHLSSKWLPILSFVLVFLVVILVVRWLANILQTAISFVMMEWLNKIGGIALYAALYTAVFSIILFYGTQANIIAPPTVAASKVYPVIEPMGPSIINGLGKLIPIFKNMFTQLEDFFAAMAKQAK